jgi:hypothetical protein
LPWPANVSHKINGGNSYGCNDHIGRDYYAIDFALNHATVSAVAGGIAYTGNDGNQDYGMYIMIDHGGGVMSLYGHLSQFLVSNGQPVTQGQQIAISGNTGNSTGAHLHFVMRTGATSPPTQFSGTRLKAEPMSGYTGFGAYGFCTGVVSPNFTSKAPTGSSGAKNMLSQASFENGAVPTGWKIINVPNGATVNAVAYQNAPPGALEGAGFLEMNTSIAGASVGQDVAASPQVNQSYTFSVWARNRGSVPFTLKIVLWGLGGGSMERSPTTVTLPVGNGWQLISAPLDVVNAGHTSLRAEIYMNTAGRNVDVDAATLALGNR